jgi:hypothetical protein
MRTGRRGGLQFTLDKDVSMASELLVRIGMRGDSEEEDDSSCIHRNDIGDRLRDGIFMATSLPVSIVHRSTHIMNE